MTMTTSAAPPPADDTTYWEVSLNEAGAFDETDTPRVTSRTTLLERIAGQRDGVTDLIVLVHGINNTMTEARGIFQSYIATIDQVRPAFAPRDRKVWFCAIYWQSTVSFNKDAHDPLRLPSEGSLSGRQIAELAAEIHRRDPDLRLHFTAHSLGTLVVGRALKRLADAGLGRAVKSTFLIQGAIPHDSFQPGRDLAGITAGLGGPVVATRSLHDPLMAAADAFMRQGDGLDALAATLVSSATEVETTVRAPVAVIAAIAGGAKTAALTIVTGTSTSLNWLRDAWLVKGTVRGWLHSLGQIQASLQGLETDYASGFHRLLRDSQPGLFGALDHHGQYRQRIRALIGTRPAAIAGLAGAPVLRLPSAVQSHWDTTVATWNRQGRTDLLTLECANVICGHDNYKVPAIAVAQLLAADLVGAPVPRPALDWPAPPAGATWMRTLWGQLADKRLNEVVLPGSHDAGTDRFTALLPVHGDQPDRIVRHVLRNLVAPPIQDALNAVTAFANGVRDKILALLPEPFSIFRLGTVDLRASFGRQIPAVVAPPHDATTAAAVEAIAPGLLNALRQRKVAGDTTTQDWLKQRIWALAKTQSGGLGFQLDAGSRYFEMRPVWFRSAFHLAHTQCPPPAIAAMLGEAGTFLGAVGPDLRTALAEVAQFATRPDSGHELIILKFSHYADIDGGSNAFAPGRYEALCQEIRAVLGDHLITAHSLGRAGAATVALDTLTLADLTAQGRTVLCVFADPGRVAAQPDLGLFRFANKRDGDPATADLLVHDEYADRNDIVGVINHQADTLRKFLAPSAGGRRGLFLLSWTVTQNATDAAALAGGDIEGPAHGINRTLLPAMETWLADGVVAKDRLPNVVFMDFIGAQAGDGPGDNEPGQPTEVLRLVRHLNTLA